MKVILINSPLCQKTTGRLAPIIENLFYNSAPLGLGYLASVLEKQGHQVRIIDAAAERLSIGRVIRRLSDYAPHVVGITTFTVSANAAYELAKEIYKALPGTKIVVGGPHITSNPREILSHPEIFAAVIGEGEVTLKELLEAIEHSGDINLVDGIARQVNGKVYLTPPRKFISDMDSLPFPARHLLPMRLYKPQPNDQKRLPKLSMISSRGCPYSCIFCDKNVFKNAYRSFSPKYIVNEMRQVAGEFKAKDIAFVDSTFTPNKERTYKIIEEIKKSGLDLSWTCSVRADVLDRQLLKGMKDAGCWRVRIGVESGNDDVLKFIRKGITRCQVRRVARWAYELDLEPKGFFMIGHLVDTKKTIEDTISFACSLPLKDITVQANTPLNNTPQEKMAAQYGKVVTGDFTDYSFFEPVFLPAGLTREEFHYYYRKIYLKFYLRPRIWYRHIIKIRSFSDIMKYLKGARIIIFFLMAWLEDRNKKKDP